MQWFDVAVFLGIAMLPICAKLPDAKCHFDGRQYSVGARWQPALRPFGVMNCVNCTCQEGGHVQCETRDCPPLTCERPVHLKGHCCPVCSNTIPTESDVSRGRGGGRKRQCLHHGITYRHGQMYPSEKTALMPTKPNQCVSCICLNGETFCHLKSCPNITCERKVQPSDSCCPVCADSRDPIKTNSFEKPAVKPVAPSPFHVLEQRPQVEVEGNNSNTNGDCTSGEKLLRNGSSWHPVIGPFGKMDCVLCVCMNGQVTCNRITCHPDHKLPCRNPQNIVGRCCKVCPRDIHRQGHVIMNSVQSALPNDLTSKPERKACLPRRTDTLVLQSETGDSVFMIFENLKTKKLERIVWKFLNGEIADFLIERIQRSEFKDLTNKQRYSIIGATQERRVSKFRRKAQSVVKRCKKRCTKHGVYKLMRKLRLQKVDRNC